MSENLINLSGLLRFYGKSPLLKFPEAPLPFKLYLFPCCNVTCYLIIPKIFLLDLVNVVIILFK